MGKKKKAKSARLRLAERVDTILEDVAPSRADRDVVASSRADEDVVAPTTADEDVVALSRADDDIVAPSRADRDVVAPSRADEDVAAPSRADDDIVAPSRADGDVVAPSRADEDVVALSKADGDVVALSRVNAGVQVMLCYCDITNTSVTVATTSRDACVQANLCHCSEYVGCNGDVSSVASQDSGIVTSVESSGVVHTLSHTAKNSHVPETTEEIHVSVQLSTDKLEPLTADTEKLVESNLKQSEAVDIEGVCNELEACYLDDTVAYEYVCEKSLLVRCNGSVVDRTDLPIDMESVLKMASTTEPEASQEDNVLVSMCNVSLQTSTAENVIDTSITVGDQSSAKTGDALPPFEDKGNESSLCSDSSAASPLLPQPSDASGAKLVHSLGNVSSDSYNESACDTSLHSSAGDKVVGEVFESKSAVVCDPDAAKSDSILVSMYNVSLQTSALEDVVDIGVRDLTNAETHDHLPSYEDRLDVQSSVCSVSVTANPLPPQSLDTIGDDVSCSSTNVLLDSDKKSICTTSLDTSVSDKLVDEVFESGYGPVRTVTNVGSHEPSDVPIFPDFDDASDREMDLHTDGIEPDLLSDESGDEISFHTSPTPPDDPNSAARKILTSTAIGSPVGISNFFGFGLSSQSGSDHSLRYSVGGGRRKSKPGRGRVSLCGEVDSPVEYFTPHRVAVGTHDLTTVVDTDEDDDGTVPNANLYKTAVEEHLLDAASETDEGSRHEPLKPAVDGCIPDSPVEGIDPFQDKSSLAESVPCPPAERSRKHKRVSAQCSVDTHRRSTAAVPDVRISCSPEHLQTKSVVLEASERSVQDVCPESESELLGAGSARSGTADKNRFEQCCITNLSLSVCS